MAEPGTARRSFGALAALGVASSALFAVAASRTWFTLTQLDATGQLVFASQRSSDISGSDLAPWVAALAVVGLAAWGAVLVTRTAGRRVALALAAVVQLAAVAGVVNAVVGSAVDAEVARRFGSGAGIDASWAPWLVVAAVSGAVAAVVAVVSFLVCPSWPSMGSRYDAPTGASASDASDGSDTDFWKQLDAGVDPTE